MSESLAGTYTPIPLKGKLALITGATGGIGQATARLFASRGVHLALHYFTQHDGAMTLVEELRATGVRVAAFQADLAEFDAVRAMHAKVVEELGHPDILYSNAAMTGSVLGIKAKIENASIEEFEKCWRANTGGAFLLTQLCVPHMEKQGYGRIVFCSSIASGEFFFFAICSLEMMTIRTATGGVLGPHYSSSKAALHGLMHWVARQYSKKGITCNAVAPALIANTVMFKEPTPAHRDLIPVGRFGQPEEVAQVVELLVTNSYMTDKIVTCDGGMVPSSLA